MSLQRLNCLLFAFLFSSGILFSQTDLHRGDIVLLSMASDLGMCGLPAQSDQFSFACFEDIEAGTEFDVTDNGWETQHPGFWGDGEGTLHFERAGGTIARGTVITVEGRLISGSWVYRVISPDNLWNITDINVPGGGFNINNGGEQLYFMAGGTWDNQGGNANKALYDGEIIYGANNLPAWSANGTVNQSNLHPDVQDCYYNIVSTGLTYSDFMEYSGPTDSTDIFGWLERMQFQPNWNHFGNCAEYSATPPSWTLGQTLKIYNNMALRCPFACTVCPPEEYNMYLYLPDGDYNVVITNGVDTFTVLDAQNFEAVPITVTESVSYWIVSVEKVGGCTVYSHFYAQADISAPYNNPGIHTELYICPTFGAYILFNYLDGNPEPGGQWSPPLSETSQFGAIYYSVWGEGTWTYYFTHGHDCPADTASVTVHFIDVDQTTIDVSCSQNGTPNNIFDDQTVVTLNVNGTEFGAGYTITSSSGTITPTTGITGIPQVFTLGAGTAIGPNVTLTIQGTDPPYCKFDLPVVVSPGYCSDPCDYEMEASISGPEDICLKNCPDNPASLVLEVSGGTAPFTMDFELYSPGYPIWTFTDAPVNSFQEIFVCVDSVPAPVYDPASHYLTLPLYLGESDITLTLLNVFDKYNCTGILDDSEVYMNIHNLPTAMSTTLNLCRDEALNIDLTEYNILINPFYDVFWYDGNPFAGGESISSPTGANLENVVTLWAKVVDDYCENAVQIPFNIFPQPHLDSIPPITICQGANIVLGDIEIVDASNSMATYTFHAGLPPDSTNVLDTLIYLPEASTTIYVLATTEHMCYDTLPIEIIVEEYPGLIVDAQPCDVENSTYSILFNSSAATIISSAGTVFNNPAGQDSISGIPNDVDVTIQVLNASGMCSDTFLILAPVCNCPQINQPVSVNESYQLCEDEPLPLISVTVDPGLQANWYTEPSGGVAFLQNSLSFQPLEATSAIFYVEALDPTTNCYSVRTAIPLTVFPLAVLANLADPVICQNDPIDLAVFVPSVLNGIPGSGSWFDLVTGQPLSGVQHPKDGKAWYYLFTTTEGACESRDTVVVTANPLPVINDYTIFCDDATLTYDIFFITDADIVLADAGTLVLIPGTDSVSILSIPFGNDVQINLTYTATGCTSTNFQQAPDCACPGLLQASNSSACNTQGDVDLTTFEGAGATGTWQVATTPPGANPAVISGNTFLGTNADTGPYGLLFIRNVLLEDCPDTANFEMVLAGVPDATFNFTQTTNSVSLEYPGIDYDSLLWSFGDGRTDNSANPTVVYAAIGQYLVTLIVYNACGTDTSSTLMNITTVSTNNPSINKSGWQIRPNPFKDNLTIYGQPLVDGTITISLLDVQGELISTEKWNHASGQVLKEIKADYLPSGVFLVVIQDEDSRVVLKAVHQQ